MLLPTTVFLANHQQTTSSFSSIAQAPASPAVEHLAPASAVLTVPAPLMEHFAPAPVVLTVQAPLKEHIAPAPAVIAAPALRCRHQWQSTSRQPLSMAPSSSRVRSACASGGARPTARDVAASHHLTAVASSRDVTASKLQAAVAAAETGRPRPRTC